MRALGEIYKNGYLYQGSKPVHWCVDCGSALAEAEVEYEDVNSPAIDVGFKFTEEAVAELKNRKILGTYPIDFPVMAVIWTTTPWTLPANQAVSVHPEYGYEIIKTDKAFLVICGELKVKTLERYGLSADALVVGSGSGKSFQGLMLQHPFDKRQVPIICGDHVTTEAGTGLVHTAAAHGNDDWLVMRRTYPDEKPRVLMDGDGKFFNSDLVELAAIRGLGRQEANKVILANMQESGALIASARLNHSFPHCWRHKTPLMQLATHQWFISMDKPVQINDAWHNLRGDALTSVVQSQDGKKLVSFYPEWGQIRLQSMIQGRPDWCVSRQRNWGVPMPFFVHKETGEPHPNTMQLLEQAALLTEQSGVEAWFSLDGAAFLAQHAPESAEQYKKVTDTLDVWFDSGTTHASVLKRRADLQYPADLYLEGSDQHRGWFQSSLLTGCAIDGRAPYKALLTHGFVVDGSGCSLRRVTTQGNRA